MTRQSAWQDWSSRHGSNGRETCFAAGYEIGRAELRGEFERAAEGRVADQTRILDLEKEVARLKNDLAFESDCLKATQENGRVVSKRLEELRIDLNEAKGTAKEALKNLDESEEEVTQLRQATRAYESRSRSLIRA